MNEGEDEDRRSERAVFLDAFFASMAESGDIEPEEARTIAAFGLVIDDGEDLEDPGNAVGFVYPYWIDEEED